MLVLIAIKRCHLHECQRNCDCRHQGLVSFASLNVQRRTHLSITLFRSHRGSVRAFLKNTGPSPAKSERIMHVIVDSGIIYCLSNVCPPSLLHFFTSCSPISQLVFLISMTIRLPLNQGMLGNIYQPVNVQFAGIFYYSSPSFVRSNSRPVTKESTLHSSFFSSLDDGLRKVPRLGVRLI